MGHKGIKKRFCLLVLCGLVFALGASALERPPLHPAVIHLCKQEYPAHVITVSDGFGDERAGQWALILSKAGQHVLAVAEKAKDEPAYRFTVENPRAIMPGDSQPRVLIDSAGDALFIGFQDENYIWDFSAVKHDGVWGDVAATVWERHMLPTSEWHMRVERGQLESTHILSDDNDNLLSSTPYPPFPVPLLAGKTTLNDYDWAAFPATPRGYFDQDSPARTESLSALLPAGWQLKQAAITPRGIFLLGDDEKGARRLNIKAWQPNQGFRESRSAPLPEDAGMDSFHMNTGLLLNTQKGALSYGFGLAADGSWLLSSVSGEELFMLGPNYLHDPHSPDAGYVFGDIPAWDLGETALADMPSTLAAAKARMDQSGWAKVNNPSPKDRLHLRTGPRRTAPSLGKFYNGTPVRVIERQGEWARVELAGLTGWMMADYLAFGADMNRVQPAFPGLVGLESLAGQEMPLHTAPDTTSPVAARRNIDYWGDYWILGAAGEDWLYVYFFQEGIGGYMKQAWFWEGNG